MLGATVNGQAAMVAYLDDFGLMTWLAIGAMPLILLLRAPKTIEVDPPAVTE